MGILERLFGNGHRGNHRWGRISGRDERPPPAVSAVCPGCYASIASSSRFCPQCGISVLPLTCRRCQSSHPAGARFCGQCGQSITA